jgi:NAD(P)H-quinone oxidoreductase subunit 5
MQTALTWLVLSGPLALAVTGLLLVFRPRAAAVDPVGRGMRAAAVAFAVATLAAIAVTALGRLSSGTLGFAGIGFAVWLDSLSVTMLLLVSFIGLVVLRYSRHYLAGDPGQSRFAGLLCLALASVLLLIVAGNLLQLAIAWVATSLALHGLLVFYRERPAAVLAARKKFLASRLGDAFLGGALVLIHDVFGSLDYGTIFATLAGGEVHADLRVAAAACLIAGAALLKCAQFPLHGWLPEVMETPTPVSALLHAGIINAGGFLVLRLAELVVAGGPALTLLALVGGFTALFGSVVMLTQTSVKVSLAWSTVAQMGFMLLQCGLGAFGAALLHLVAHSLYKAHAFLSSGSVIDVHRAAWTPNPAGQPQPARLLLALGAVVAGALAIGTAFGASLAEAPGTLALGVIMTLGLTQLIAFGIDGRPSAFVLGRTVLLAMVVAGSWFGLHAAAEQLFAGALPAAAQLDGPLDLFIVVLVLLSFAALSLLQGLLPQDAPRWHALYALVANGFYVNTFINRWVLQYWPDPEPAGRRAAEPGFHQGAL